MSEEEDSQLPSKEDSEVLPVEEDEEAEIVTRASSWSGPLPSPRSLREFEEIVPGSADRLITMVEKQGNHRMEIEKRVVDGESRRAWVELAARHGITLVGIIASILLVVFGYTPAGVILTGLTTLFAAVTYLIGRILDRILNQPSEPPSQ
ncbi:MAG: DUF2335 domain-containing protein [Chloroflexota bacterium]|nr:DUF2335 domain-containing protein [Chloroflexota bacterium]MDE2929716.1 DUF2335 domain-containing protein [Chloroflexota bacterium]